LDPIARAKREKRESGQTGTPMAGEAKVVNEVGTAESKKDGLRESRMPRA